MKAELAEDKDIIEMVLEVQPEPNSNELIAKVIEAYHNHDMDVQQWVQLLFMQSKTALVPRK